MNAVDRTEAVEAEVVDLATRAERANRYYEEAQASLHTGVIAAWHSGQELLAAKDQLKHGEWLPWLAANFKGSDRTANIYMQLAKSAAPADLGSSIDSTLKAIREASGDDPQISVIGSALAADLHRIVHNALLFASRDDTTAATNLIRIESVDGDILGIGTNRLVLGVTRCPYTGAAAIIQLTRDAAEKLVVATKPYKPPLPVVIGVTARTVAFKFTDGNTIEFPNQPDGPSGTDLAYPDWRALIPDDPTEPADSDDRHFGIQPELLALLAKVSTDGDNYTGMTITWVRPLRVSGRPLRVTIGESFIGVLTTSKGQPFQRPTWV